MIQLIDINWTKLDNLKLIFDKLIKKSKIICLKKLDIIGAFSFLSMSTKTVDREPSEMKSLYEIALI